MVTAFILKTQLSSWSEFIACTRSTPLKLPDLPTSIAGEELAAAEALVSLQTVQSVSTAASSAISMFSSDLGSSQSSENRAIDAWTAQGMEMVAELADKAGFHTCKLDLEECLMLGDWYAAFGTFMMPSKACLSSSENREECTSLRSFRVCL